MTCYRCGHEIQPGEVYARGRSTHNPYLRTRPKHIGCPTEREVKLAGRRERALEHLRKALA